MSVPVRSTLRSTLLWAVLPALVVYAVALVWSGAEGISAKLVLRDLAQSCKAPLGEGFLSSVGYLLWMAAAAIALFAASTRQIQRLRSEPSIRLLWWWLLALALPRRHVLGA